MYLFDFSVKSRVPHGHWQSSGRAELRPGITRITVDLPESTLETVSGSLTLYTGEDERIFMNGFQTWTHSPEYYKWDRIRGLQGLPKAGIRHFGLDRYGDYYFTEYPYRKGSLHGVSWCYFRRGDFFRLFASLDERPGYTRFRYEAGKNTLCIDRDCADLKTEGEYHAFDLFYAEGTEAEVFDAWFAAMDIRPRTRERLYGYSSWYNHYEKISQQTIENDFAGFTKVFEPGDLFQIDDGWEPAVGDWLAPDPKKFSCSMEELTERIHAGGFKAGLWLAPFVCAKKSRIFREHPDWLYQKDGKPWYLGSNWGGFYSLDFDHPEVKAYLREVFRTVFDKWHFDLVKLDFLYGGAPFGGENETRAGRMYRLLEFLREVCGEHLILGCGVPVMPAFGLVDYCRIGCDVGLDWNGSRLMQRIMRERVSTKQAIENTIFRRQLNGRAYGSDPDVFFLREENLKLTAEEKDILAETASLFSGICLTSDDPGRYGPIQSERLKKIRSRAEATGLQIESGRRLAVSFTQGGEQIRYEIPRRN